MVAQRKIERRMTVEEFLAWSGGGHQGKLELVDGVVCAQQPASATHALIQGNLVVLIRQHLRVKKSPCRVAPEAPVVPRLGAKTNARAPDVAVTCAPPSASKTFDDPVLPIEVLSPGNEDEAWENVRAYGTIPSVREIAVVESEKVGAVVFRKGADGAWPAEGEAVAAGGTLQLDSIEADWPLAEFYKGTYLE
jgi:Uma2 family endonuclease